MCGKKRIGLLQDLFPIVYFPFADERFWKSILPINGFLSFHETMILKDDFILQ